VQQVASSRQKFPKVCAQHTDKCGILKANKNKLSILRGVTTSGFVALKFVLPMFLLQRFLTIVHRSYKAMRTILKSDFVFLRLQLITLWQTT